MRVGIRRVAGRWNNKTGRQRAQSAPHVFMMMALYAAVAGEQKEEN